MAKNPLTAAARLALLVASVFVFFPRPVAADWTDSFPDGSPQQFWLFDSSPGIVLSSATTFSTGSSSGGIVLQGFALGGPNVAYGIVPTDSFGGTGVIVRSLINPTGVVLSGSEAGVVTQVDTGAGTGYTATIGVSASGTQSTLRIAEIAETIVSRSSSSLLTFSPTNSYVVELETLGPLLMARAYDSTSTLVLAQASVFDPTPLVQGFAGVGVWTTGSAAPTGGRWGTTSAAAPLPSLVWTPSGVIPSGTFATGTWSGTWSTGSSNWFATTGTATRWDTGKVAVFGGNTVTGTTAGGTVTVTGTAGVVVSTGIRFAVDGYRILSGSQAPISLSGTIAPFIDVVPAGSATIAAALTGTMGFRKTGAGTLVVTGSSSYIGPTTILGGTLVLGTNASIASSSVISIDSGATFDATQKGGGYIVPWGQTIAGTGTVAARVIGVSEGATLSPGKSPGNLTLSGSVSFGSGGNYNWQMLSGTGTAGSSTAWDLLDIVGSLSVAATPAEPFKINLWTLSGISPDVTGSASGFISSSNYTWKIATASGGISGFAADKFLISTSASNGTGGFANAYGAGTFAITQSGNDLNLVFTAGPIHIGIPSGTLTQTQAGYPILSGSLPLVKTGAGTLVIDQSNTLTGSTSVQAGILRLATSTALGSSPLAVVAGGTAQVATAVRTTVAGLNLVGNGLVDVGSGLMTVTNGLSATDLVAEILEGRGTGLWTGTSGITSSTAAGDVALGLPRAVGWLDNGNGSVSFAFAAPGDTNLDWQVNVLDVANILTASKFNTGSPATWAQGDFNYDGVVDVLDAADFITTGLYNHGSYDSSLGSVAAVPEPSSITAAFLGTVVSVWLARRKAV